VDEITSRTYADCTGDLPTHLHGGHTVEVEVEQLELAQSQGSEGTYTIEVRQCPRNEPMEQEDHGIDLAELHTRQLHQSLKMSKNMTRPTVIH
ncbi:hypothetical protein PanWU01x14_184570, partial [Parasponia andersonii]